MEKSKYSLLGAAMMFTGAVLFSVKAIMVKLCYQYHIDAPTLLALRMIFSFPFFLSVAIYAILNNKNAEISISKITSLDWLKLIFLGIIGYYLASIFDFEGLKYVPAGVERLILFIYPTLVVLMTAFLYKRQIKTIEIYALMLTYLGVGLVYWHDVSGNGSNMVWGAVLVFLSALTYAMYIVGSGKLIPKFGVMFYTACAMLVSTVATVAHQVLFSDQSLFGLPTEVYAIVLMMAVFSTVIPGFMVSQAIKMIGASQSSIIASVGPVSTIILAYFFLGEAFTLYQFFGTLLVLSGVVMVSLKK